MFNIIIRRGNLVKSAFVAAIALIALPVSYAAASGTSNFQQTINSGVLSSNIVDGTYAAVSSPSVAMSNATFALNCQTITGTFGTSSQKLYVSNLGTANDGWTLTVAASAATSVWDGAASDFDFNDPTTSGCTDGADADSVGGQLTIDASAATLATGQCVSCSTSSITKGSAAAFSSGVTDNLTLLSAAAGSSDAGDWTLTGVSLSQTLPAEQAAASDYDINMVLTATAS